MPEKRSEYELDERAAEARFVLNNAIFQEAVASLREQYIKNLMNSRVGTEEALMAHARLIVLEEFIAQIGSALTDQKMTKQRKPNYGN